MSNFKEALVSFIIFLLLIIVPLLGAWWLYFPLAFLFIFFGSRSVGTLISAFILDLVYFSFPWLSFFVLIVLALNFAFRDKLRI
jgi:hypothetical protein